LAAWLMSEYTAEPASLIGFSTRDVSFFTLRGICLNTPFRPVSFRYFLVTVLRIGFAEDNTRAIFSYWMAQRLLNHFSALVNITIQTFG
jgi:hypothetical protein